MAKNKKPLLNEGTVRRMMKLAEIDSLSDQFIGQSYVTEEEDEEGFEDVEGGEEEDIEGIEDVDVEEEAPEEEGLEGEITITDEEAQDIIDLAAKLEDAVGGAPGGEEELEMEPEAGLEPEAELAPEDEEGLEGEEELEELEEPGNRYEESLYEAALRGLEIDVVDDQEQKAAAVLQEVKSRIYKRVVNRLLKESKKPAKPTRRRKR